MIRGRHIYLALIAASSLAAAGCLTATKQSRLQTDMGQVREQMFDMQRDTASILMRLESIEDGLNKRDDASPARFADLETLLRTLTDEVRSLGARIDDNTSRMTALSRDVIAAREQYRALEARLAAALATRVRPAFPTAPRVPGEPIANDPALGNNPNSLTAGQVPGMSPLPNTGGSPVTGSTLNPAAPAGNGSPGMTGVAGSQPPSTQVSGNQPPGSQASSGAATLSGTVPGNTPGTTPGSPPPEEFVDEAAQEEAYRLAYTDYTRGSFDGALSGFQEFLRRFPSSPLAGRSQYYIGESHFSQQRYAEAAEAFTLTIENHPGSDKTAAAYLKKGLSLLALRQTARGVIQLQHVIETYPRSDEARISAERLRQLGLRDH
jgi:tol-pal system protein YbgF